MTESERAAFLDAGARRASARRIIAGSKAMSYALPADR